MTPNPKELQGYEPARVSFYACLLFGLSYPWSIAASTTLLAICGGLGLFFARKKDLAKIWKNHQPVIVAISIYLGYFVLSACWSIDPNEAWMRLARKWSWVFLLPLAMLLMRSHDARNGLYIGITAGLGSHLILCLIQWTQIVPIDRTIFWGTVHLPLPSTAMDPTGLMDHLHFGFIHGMYAAFIFHRFISGEKVHPLSIAVALLGIMFSFLAQGRTGYIVIIALFLLIIIMNFKLLNRNVLSLIVASCVVLGTTIALNPSTQARIHHITSDPTRTLQWRVAVDIWRDSPWIGVGAGGYDKAKNEKIKTLPIAQQKPWIFGHNHPHSIYFWHLSTGGIIGLLTVLLLFGSLIWTGIRYWQTGGASIAMAGLALTLHGAFNDSLEQHFPLFAAIIAVSLGIAESSSSSRKETKASYP